eukprot:8466259-Ditylum_brightwellii.AAC.1
MNPWKKAKWMGFEPNSSDHMTYYVKTEDARPRYLIRSVICTRRRHVGTEREHANDDTENQE